VSTSPSNVTATEKSSSPLSPSVDGAVLPTVAVTRGRGGRPAAQPAGMRKMMPAASRSAAEPSRLAAFAGLQRSGW
jgi:hypothetical protein